jgi:hypothetical protein
MADLRTLALEESGHAYETILGKGADYEIAVSNCAAQTPSHIIDCDFAMLIDGFGEGTGLALESLQAKLPKRWRVLRVQGSDFNL